MTDGYPSEPFLTIPEPGGPPRILRVMVFGSSISMISRPAGSGPPYPKLLEHALNEGDNRSIWMVENISSISGTIDDFPAHVGHVVAAQPDFVILHYGYPEALRRPQSRALWLWTHLYVPGLHPAKRNVKVMGRRWAGFRRRLGWLSPWVSATRFERVLREGVRYLQKECPGTKIVLIEINPSSPFIEHYAPGSSVNIQRFNDIQLQVASETQISVLTLEDVLFSGASSQTLLDVMEDGTHFNGEGHRRLSAKLARLIVGLMKAESDAATSTLLVADRSEVH